MLIVRLLQLLLVYDMYWCTFYFVFIQKVSIVCICV